MSQRRLLSDEASISPPNRRPRSPPRSRSHRGQFLAPPTPKTPVTAYDLVSPDMRLRGRGVGLLIGSYPAYGDGGSPASVNTVPNVYSGWIPLAIGVGLLVGAIVDPRGYFTRMYEDNPKAVSGFWSLSWSARGFRIWIAIAGCFGIAVGIGLVVAGS
jgi:hypothetical protein